MHANRILLPLLILTSLTVDLVLVGSLSERSTWPDFLVAVLLGSAAGQINLVTLWAVLGYRHLPWRVALLLVVPIAWSFAVVISAPNILLGYDAAATWGVHFLTQTALLASILFFARLLGARLMHDELAPNDQPTRRLQFTLRYLFGWLTATAIALSSLKTTFENAKITPTDFEWQGILILGFVSAMLGLSCAWLILDTRIHSNRLKAAFVTALPAATVVVAGVFLLPVSPDKLCATLYLWFVATAYASVAFVVLRVAGFRIVWLENRCESRC